MRVEGEFTVNAPRGVVYQRLADARLIAACLPGCEQAEQLDTQRYSARVMVSLGGVNARFDLIVEITEREPPSRLVCVTRGDEGGRTSMLNAQSEIELSEGGPQSTNLRYASEIALTGRLGRFALGVMNKKVQALATSFASALNLRLAQDAESPDAKSTLSA